MAGITFRLHFSWAWEKQSHAWLSIELQGSHSLLRGSFLFPAWRSNDYQVGAFLLTTPTVYIQPARVRLPGSLVYKDAFVRLGGTSLSSSPVWRGVEGSRALHLVSYRLPGVRLEILKLDSVISNSGELSWAYDLTTSGPVLRSFVIYVNNLDGGKSLSWLHALDYLMCWYPCKWHM